MRSRCTIAHRALVYRPKFSLQSTRVWPSLVAVVRPQPCASRRFLNIRWLCYICCTEAREGSCSGYVGA
jgi:hypothetical protein